LSRYSFEIDDPEQDINTHLFPVKKDGKYGYIDQTGKLVIKPQFHKAEVFSEGLARVSIPIEGRSDLNNLKSNPDHTVQSAVNVIGSDIHKPVNEKFGFISPDGSFAIKPEFDHAWDFSDGRAMIRIGNEHEGLHGYIDKSGKVVIEPQFKHAKSFSEGMAEVGYGAKKGFINREGEMVIATIFDDAFPFREELAVVNIGKGNDRKCGFIDKGGNFVILPEFYKAQSFSEGLAAVAKFGWHLHNNWGFIDRYGNCVIPPQFDDVGRFSGSLAAARVPLPGIITRLLPSPAPVSPLYGFINKSGVMIIQPGFASASAFSEGLCKVHCIFEDQDTSDPDNPNQRAGFINTGGSVVINYLFAQADDFHNELSRVKVGTKWGYINKSGRFVWEPSS
jgi:hypothetical protein